MKYFKLFLVWGIMLILCSTVWADIPNLINFQGVLDSAGNPLANKTKSVEFSIYDALAGGNLKWSETQSVTTNAGGVFNVVLGSSNPIPDTAFADTLRYLGIKVGGDPEMTPRQQIVSNAYGYRVAHFVPDFGSGNTFIGLNAGNLTMTGNNNTASGDSALASNTTGSSNIANGTNALEFNTTGNENIASGYRALASNTTGDNNTASGYQALHLNTTGFANTAIGYEALRDNTAGFANTAIGRNTLQSNTVGTFNTSIGYGANVSAGNLTNATAIGNGATVNASNKIRLGNASVTVIEGQVAYTFTSDENQKENFQPVDGEEILRKIREFNLTSWNYIGHDPKQFRHYGPTAQEFFAAFGQDGVGTIGTPTTINSGDMAGILLIAVQLLEKEKELLKGNLETIQTENSELKARIEELENRMKRLAGEDRIESLKQMLKQLQAEQSEER